MIGLKRIGMVLFCCFLLCSCSKEVHSNKPGAVEYLPESKWEQTSGGALQAYQINTDGDFQLYSMDDALVSITESDGKFLFSKLSGEQLLPTSVCVVCLPPEFPPENMQADANGLRYYVPSLHQLIVLDTQLQEIDRIILPEDLPRNVLSSDELDKIFYYDSGICQIDLRSSLRGVIREKEMADTEILGLFQDGQLLLCKSKDTLNVPFTALISTENGQTVHKLQGDWRVFYANDTWLLTHFREPEEQILFGEDFSTLQALTPKSGSTFLAWDAGSQIVYTVQSEPQTVLEAYSLEDGRKVASITLDAEINPSAVATKSLLYFPVIDETSGNAILLKWNPLLSKTEDPNIYIGPNYNDNQPDFDGLQQCKLQAAALSRKYGLNILVAEEAITVQPWDYAFQPEYRVSQIQQKLEALESLFSQFPDGFLSELSEKLGIIHISLVASIDGKTDSGSLQHAKGLQFWLDGHGYIAISSSADISHDLTHELSHMIDTVVMNACNAFDNWDQLNPEGFSYYQSYSGVMRSEDQLYLQDDTRAFIDAYSMTFAAEDRARILEYALNNGNEALFDAPILQEKLRILCIGIRKAMGLSKSPDNFQWEQYLWHSISYKSI